VEYGAELVGDSGEEVVAVSFCVRTVDDADRSFQLGVQVPQTVGWGQAFAQRVEVLSNAAVQGWE
jgi:hypothetical protein